MITEPATRPNQSKPLTAPATSSAVARPQPPVTRIAQAGDDAALHHHDRDAVEQRLDAVLADRGVDAAAVDLAQMAWTSGVAAASFTVRTESSAETSDAAEAGPGGRRRGRGPAGHAASEATTRAAEATMTRERARRRRVRLPADQRR